MSAFASFLPNGFSVLPFGVVMSFLKVDITPIMENQMEKNMENEMETREYMGIIRVKGTGLHKLIKKHHRGGSS